MSLTTPKTVTKNVYRLRQKIGVSTEPVFVPVRAPRSGKFSDCFSDVARKIKSDGGTIQHGWTVWERPGKLIEGEFHAVWVSPEGEMVDVSPKADGERTILFLPDPERTFQNENVDNVRLALSDDPETNRTIRFHEEMAALRRKYNDGSGESRIPMQEALAVERRYGLGDSSPVRAVATPGRNDPCPCGSGKKFKRCHGAG